MRRSSVSLVLCALLLVASAAVVLGQTFTGGLRGAVRDAQGVIPGVTVSITNEATGISRETTSNEVGEYAFPAVVPGTYALKTALTGYKTFERRGVRVGTQQFITLDVLLEIGTIEEQITVTADAPLIETSNASTGEVLDRQVLESMPSPGRAAFLMGVQVPTFVATGDAQFNRQQDQTNASLVSLGGGARRANNYLLDGFPITDMVNRSVVNPTIEALEEVKVQVHTYDAEMGRTGGGVFNVTGKSGSNEFHGSGFFQTRPLDLLEQNYFLKRSGVPLPPQYYRLYGTGGGGPIVRNRAFFWVAAEGYRSNTTRNGNLIFPTALQRRGDFSQTRDRNGNLITIYDPLTRQPFTGNVIPPGQINSVGQAIVNLMPKPDRDVSDGAPNYVRQAQIIDAADMVTSKGDYRFSDKVTLSGMYLFNKTDEPFGVYWDENRYMDPNATPLRRRIHAVVINNTVIASDTTVFTLRGGWNRFRDDNIPITSFDPGTLGFSPAFVSAMQFKKFPSMNIQDYGELPGNGFGAGSQTLRRFYSWGLNGALTKLVGRHSWKFGGDFRQLGLEFQSFAASSGNFTFDRTITSSATGAGGNALASLLLGFPSSGSFQINTPFDFFTRYYGAYVQDDWRMGSNFTLNYGLRYEFEQGLMERNDQTTVGFDQNATSPLNALVRLPDGRQIKGGLIYAGQDGAPRHQGDPPAAKLSPRVGAVWSATENTVVRGGYGIFWAPWNYPGASGTAYGQLGYTALTTLQQNVQSPTVSLDNPFPSGIVQPTGNARGLLSGVGGNIIAVDQTRGAPRVQQWSIDVQRQLPGDVAVSVGYQGARGDDLSLGGVGDASVNINQIDPAVLQQFTPAQLLQRVPNPFFGVAAAGPFASLATIERGQLLRPFPQFRDIELRQVTRGKSRYHAVIFMVERRAGGSNWWGGRFHYTLSQLKDNQFGEGNHFASRPGVAQNNYDLDAEFAHGLLDSPHRLILAPIFDLPFGEGRQFLNRGGLTDALLGGWQISAVGSFESGFPTAAAYSSSFAQRQLGLFGAGLRPNLTDVDPNTSGSWEERISPAVWVNRAGYAQPPAGQFGTAPRTDTRVRTPFRKNLDMVLTKTFRTGGPTRAQLRIELLNLTNTPKFRDYTTNLDAGTFGIISRQSGFMRITQISVRFLF